jgi:outer membrane PBP1 activator LpoA protein
MQSVFLRLSILFALYAAGGFLSTTLAAPLTPMEAATQSAVRPTISFPVEPRAIPVNPNATAHIALLLPLEDKDFSESAVAVRDGFLSAAGLTPLNLPVHVYGNSDEYHNVTELYRKAIANGAKAVVGPLTRKGVSVLAAEANIVVPTLALNIVDARPAEQLYFFGLSADAEARTVAELAALQNFHQAIVIATGSAMSLRLQFAFEEAWSKLGRSIVREIDFKDDTNVLSDLRVAPDTLVFLATDAQKAQQIRPFLPAKLPTYSTSQIFDGNQATLTNFDLGGIHFVDMPWLLQPEQSAMQLYPRSVTPLSADRERLYALGIDAYRLVQLMLTHELVEGLPLEGVTGKIQLDQHVLRRTAIEGVFSQGRAQSAAAEAAPALQMFPGQLKPKP